jgi:tryptophan synthase alpha chain
LVRAGADVIELGVPFSDPIADGPTNQKASERALASGTTLAKILDFVAALRSEGVTVPIVLFSYLNPIFRMGAGPFSRQAAKSGVDGVLVVDLPPEQAPVIFGDTLTRAGIDPIFLAAPTTTQARLEALASVSSGFVYCVSRLGVTGTRAELPSGLAEQVQRVRNAARLPVAVGFGISRPEHAASLRHIADGVVVGSALVRLVEELGGDSAGPAIEALAASLVAPLRGPAAGGQ